MLNAVPFSPISLTRPFRLIPDFRERVWGVSDLRNWFDSAPDRTIGEAWFTAPDNRTEAGPTLGELLAKNPNVLGTGRNAAHPELCPLLVKLLFTSSRLSVQVHPRDEYAHEHHNCLGKTEAWYVIDAEPNAEVALGFKEDISPERFRSAALTGEIEHLLDWKPVKAGDVVFVPAGTVHAIGAGLTICEVQQNSDITYRIYDYGRPRELHLDHGCAVSHLGPYLERFEPKSLGNGRTIVAESDYFRIEHLRCGGARELAGNLPHYVLFVCLKGEGQIAGKPTRRGDVWMVPAQGEPVTLEGNSTEWLLTYTGTAEPPKFARS